MKVLVIGAGPAGCALASGLKKANIDFAMYDKGAGAHRNRYWAFTLGWARPYLQKLLPDHLAKHLSQCQVDPKLDSAAIGEDRIVMYNGQTREERYSFPTPHAMEMNIRKLREFMSAELPVQYNKILTRYEILPNGKGVRVYFSDGTSDEGDVVAGFDGAGSMVRQQLLGLASHADLLPFTLMNFIASYTAEQALYIKEKLHPLVDIAVHPAGHYIRFNVLDMPDHDKPETWTFQILSTWPVKNVEDYDNEGERLSRLKAYVKKEGWAEPYKSTIEWIPDDTEVLRDQLKIWKPVKWDNHGGRVTLGGDAAHAMTFHRGQGANNAFYDAYCFVEAIKTVVAGTASLEKAIGEYSDAVLKRGQGEVQVSKTQTFFTHDWEHFLNSPVIGLGTRPSHDAPSEGYQ